MSFGEIALVTRARGLATHCLSREALETLAEAPDLPSFARAVSRLGDAIDPIGDPLDVSAVERAAARTANRHLQLLHRWQEHSPGALDVFAAHQDRRSLRALLRGAAQGASSHARLDGLFPTPSLPLLALTGLAHQASPADVVRQLVLLRHPDARRLQLLVQASQADLLAIEVALLVGFAQRATRAAVLDDSWREFVSTMIDAGNLQNAIVMAGEPRDVDPTDLFVHGGRWLSANAFVSAARSSPPHALTTLAAALARSPLAPLIPVVPGDIVNLERSFLSLTLARLTRASRIDPLSHAPLLRALLLIDAQSRDVRTLAWGAALGTPASLRKQQLVTPS
jgi:vacuolar-type H+-ATPase subunit C/Vma6